MRRATAACGRHRGDGDGGEEVPESGGEVGVVRVDDPAARRTDVERRDAACAIAAALFLIIGGVAAAVGCYAGRWARTPAGQLHTTTGQHTPSATALLHSPRKMCLTLGLTMEPMIPAAVKVGLLASVLAAVAGTGEEAVRDWGKMEFRPRWKNRGMAVLQITTIAQVCAKICGAAAHGISGAGYWAVYETAVLSLCGCAEQQRAGSVVKGLIVVFVAAVSPFIIVGAAGAVAAVCALIAAPALLLLPATVPPAAAAAATVAFVGQMPGAHVGAVVRVADTKKAVVLFPDKERRKFSFGGKDICYHAWLYVSPHLPTSLRMEWSRLQSTLRAKLVEVAATLLFTFIVQDLTLWGMQLLWGTSVADAITETFDAKNAPEYFYCMLNERVLSWGGLVF
eukprot:gene12138-8761_t